MKNTCLAFLAIFCFSCSERPLTFETESLSLSMNSSGQITSLADRQSGINYLSQDSISYLIQIRKAGEFIPPTEASVEQGVITLQFPQEIEAKVRMTKNTSHLALELISISDPTIDLVQWGPYQTIIKSIIGETVGVVQGEEYALGLQSLNMKTLGGYPWNENDAMPQFDIFDSDDYSDMSEEGKGYTLYRVEAAKPTNYGSSLQAYTRNRTENRIIKNWGHESYEAPSYEDNGPVGSQIALFGVPKENALKTIGEIEVKEGLPHPLIDGQWGKEARSASAAYMIMSFNESNIEKCLEYTKKAGLRYLYHGGPFENWGHFELKDDFADGWSSLKNCVEIAKKQDVFLGVHTLSNFITTNDPYVTPVPDPRLAIVGASIITEDLSETAKEVQIESPQFFNQFQNNHLRTVRIGNELIRYGSVSESEPWKLLDCQRGAFETVAQSHKNGDQVSKLTDHAYKVFLTNPDLGKEMSATLAALYNETGIRQISFDGLEGNRSTGMGNYGEILFTYGWYENLSEEIKSHYIADASRTSHFFWHIYTRMNWGEPWYADFRVSQTEYRLKNQKYFKRNLMPGMLGWFSMRNHTSIEDIEWMLARSAAFNAGYSFVTSIETMEENGHTDEILELIKIWEEARMADAFSEDQKKRMEDIKNEFTLTKQENQWTFNQVYSFKFNHEDKVRQPGEPLHSTFQFNSTVPEKPIHIILSAIDADLSEIKVEINNYKEITIPGRLKKGETFKYTGGSKALVYSKTWQLVREVNVTESDFVVKSGDHQLLFDCKFSSSGENPNAKLEVRIIGEEESIGL